MLGVHRIKEITVVYKAQPIKLLLTSLQISNAFNITGCVELHLPPHIHTSNHLDGDREADRETDR